MIEEYPTRRGQLDAARPANQQLNAQLQFEVVDLPAQRRLCGMQPLLRRHGQAAFLGHGHEVAQVSKLHGSYPSKVWLRSYKVFLLSSSPIYMPNNGSGNVTVWQPRPPRIEAPGKA